MEFPKARKSTWLAVVGLGVIMAGLVLVLAIRHSSGDFWASNPRLVQRLLNDPGHPFKYDARCFTRPGDARGEKSVICQIRGGSSYVRFDLWYSLPVRIDDEVRAATEDVRAANDYCASSNSCIDTTGHEIAGQDLVSPWTCYINDRLVIEVWEGAPGLGDVINREFGAKLDTSPDCS